ncbi:hypothetical protein IPF37_03890 [bacterium]|nr:MAG: hypothetical protein IPF37_03890 [bacterium]
MLQQQRTECAMVAGIDLFFIGRLLFTRALWRGSFVFVAALCLGHFYQKNGPRLWRAGRPVACDYRPDYRPICYKKAYFRP